jgi:ATP-dependent 26S proteasome regulatory subunit
MTRRTPTSPPTPDPEEARQRHEILQLLQLDPSLVVDELFVARRSVRESAEAVEQINRLLQSLVEKNANLFHLESLHRTPTGHVRAVCRLGSQLQELGVHPEVSVEALEGLQPWEYVCVHEGVVIGTWHNDPALLAAQFGELVTFEHYSNRERTQVRVKQLGGQEAIVTLAPLLRSESLTHGTKLVLQRDDERWAIAALPADNAESKFEVPLDHVRTRLEDLAGLDELSEQFIQDILLRVVFTDVRENFDLAALRGALLYSYQPGMGKTAFCEALAAWLRDYGALNGFDVALYHVKPNQLKSMWWGEDARIVREDLFGSIRARQSLPRELPLVRLLVLDEIDSLQKRGGGERMVSSSSHSDALEALLVEMQGLGGGGAATDGPPVHLLCIGLTNRPDRLDEALKRPGRLGDLVCSMPAVTSDSAADIMAIYARKASLPWSLGGHISMALDREQIREHFLCPAVARVYPLVVARYATDTQRTVDITAGQILAGVHYQDAMNRAKRRAGLRTLHAHGVPAICPEDVVDCLLDVAIDTARQMEADPGMLVHQLQIKTTVARVTAVSKTELEQHRFLKLHSA